MTNAKKKKKKPKNQTGFQLIYAYILPASWRRTSLWKADKEGQVEKGEIYWTLTPLSDGGEETQMLA